MNIHRSAEHARAASRDAPPRISRKAVRPPGNSYRTAAYVACVGFALLASAGGLHAQQAAGRVTVRVRREGAPVERAYVRSGDTGASTDRRGDASLRLPAGERLIVVHHLGFVTDTLRLAVRAGMDTAVTVQLRVQAVEELAIVATAGRSGKLITDQATRVEALPQEEIEENLTLSPGGLTTLLNELGGIRVRAAAPGLGGAGFSVQGLRGRYTQLLADGLPLYGEHPDAFALVQVPPLDLAQVEVVKGAASALYGGTALGGVVNLVSKRPGGDPVMLLNGTSQRGGDAAGFAGGSLGRGFGYTVLGAADRQPRRDTDGDGWADVPGYGRGSVRPRLFWDGGAGRSVFATVGYLAEERRGGTVDGARLPDGSEFREALGTRRVDGGLSGRFPTRGGLLLGVRAAAAETRRRRSFGEEGDRERTRTGLAEATLGGTAGLHAWLLGAAVQHDALSSAANPAAGYGRTVPGVFAQDEYAPAEWLRVAASVRADFDRGFGTRVSPRASLLLRPAEPFTVRLSAGAGYMPPTRLVEEVEAVGLQRLVPPGRLRAERARNGSVDVGWASARWQVTETLFAAEIRDAVLARPSLSAPGLLELVNAASPTRAWGSELLASFNAAPLHVIAAHTFTRSREADPERARRVESPLVPRHALSLDVLLESEARGRIGVETSYTGRQRLEDDPYRQWSRSYLLVGVLGELRFGETGVFLNAENLGGVRQTRWEPLLRPSAGPGGRWTTDAWAPLDGRKLNLGVRLEL